jgi:phosphoribosylformimino-5-aminoimidazole carboxamide ribotide isomerase
MDVIPAIDLLDGKAVRLRQGRYDAVTVYSDRPEALAAAWRGGAPRLHVVDLEGARTGRPVQADLVRRVVAAFGPGVQIGGGIRNADAARAYLGLGVDRIVLGTAAIRDPGFVASLAREAPDRVIVAVDARDGRVATDGWLDVSERRAVDLVRELSHLPLAAVLYTDIERDGTEVGPNVAATAELAEHGGVPVIASGGVGTLEHLRELARARPPIQAAIVGRALHEARFSLADAVRAAEDGAPAG